TGRGALHVRPRELARTGRRGWRPRHHRGRIATIESHLASGTVELEWCASGDHHEVVVAVQQRNAFADGDRSDETIDELPHGLAAAATGTVDRRRIFEIDRFAWQQRGAGKQSAQLLEVRFVSSAG